MMTNSPLQLEVYFYPRVLVEANSDYVWEPKRKLEIESKTEISISKTESAPRKYGVTLEISVSSKDGVTLPYTIEVTVFGAFTVSDRIPDKYVEDAAAMNGATILYGAARELVLSLTERGPWPSVILPTTTFSGMRQQRPVEERTKRSDAKPKLRRIVDRKSK